MRTLPLPEVAEIPPEALLTTRGRVALETWLYVRAGVTEEELAEICGMSIARIRRRLSYAQTRIWRRLGWPEEERPHCRVCHEPLAIDSREDAECCQDKSTCRSKLRRQGIKLRPSYAGRSTSRP